MGTQNETAVDKRVIRMDRQKMPKIGRSVGKPGRG